MLARAKDRIVLNLDIGDAIHPEVIDAVARAGGAKRVIVKTTTSIATVPLDGMPPCDRVPFMPVLRFPQDERQLLDVIRTQLSGARRPLGFELPRLFPAILPALAEAARCGRVRLWINTLEDGYVAGLGGDREAAADPARAWGTIPRLGISMIRTDDPEGLLHYEARR